MELKLLFIVSSNIILSSMLKCFKLTQNKLLEILCQDHRIKLTFDMSTLKIENMKINMFWVISIMIPVTVLSE